MNISIKTVDVDYRSLDIQPTLKNSEIVSYQKKISPKEHALMVAEAYRNSIDVAKQRLLAEERTLKRQISFWNKASWVVSVLAGVGDFLLHLPQEILREIEENQSRDYIWFTSLSSKQSETTGQTVLQADPNNPNDQPKVVKIRNNVEAALANMGILYGKAGHHRELESEAQQPKQGIVYERASKPNQTNNIQSALDSLNKEGALPSRTVQPVQRPVQEPPKIETDQKSQEQSQVKEDPFEINW